jgi:hypothetical protein
MSMMRSRVVKLQPQAANDIDRAHSLSSRSIVSTEAQEVRKWCEQQGQNDDAQIEWPKSTEQSCPRESGSQRQGPM